jgi:hypothetical protein
MNLVNFLGLKTIDEFAKEVNPTTKQRKAYMCLDSLYARFLNGNTKLQWDFVNTLTEGPHSTNMQSKIRNITSIRMLSIVTPMFPSIAQRASIAIEEFNSQSFILPNGRKFHFIGLLNPIATGYYKIAYGDKRYAGSVSIPDFTINNKYEIITCNPSFNDGYYRFNKPINTIDTISITMSDPFNPVIFPVYQYENIPISFAKGTMTLTFPENIILPGGYPLDPIFGIPADYYVLNIWITSIFISGFTTSNPTADAIWIDTINKYEFTNIKELIPSPIIPDVPPLYPPLPTPSPKQIVMDTTSCLRAGKWSIYPIIFPGQDKSPDDIFLPTRHLPPPVGTPSNVTVRLNSNRLIMNFELEYTIE